jgi:hypothetical protein
LTHAVVVGNLSTTYGAETQVFKVINDKYLSQIKPLITNTCLSCHGEGKLSPWYRNFPFVRGYIDNHISRAKEKLEMSQGVPFKGKGKQSDIFWSITQSLENDRMPPFNFNIMHRDLKLSNVTKLKLINWFKQKRLILLKEDL